MKSLETRLIRIAAGLGLVGTIASAVISSENPHIEGGTMKCVKPYIERTENTHYKVVAHTVIHATWGPFGARWFERTYEDDIAFFTPINGRDVLVVSPNILPHGARDGGYDNTAILHDWSVEPKLDDRTGAEVQGEEEIVIGQPAIRIEPATQECTWVQQ